MGASIKNTIFNFFYEIMFGILKVLAIIIDTIISIVRMLLGLDPLEGGTTPNLVLEALQQENVIWGFVIVCGISFVTVFIFALIRIIRSQLNDEKDDGGVSKHKAWKGILVTIFNVLIIPAFVIALTLGTTAIAQGIDIATGGGEGLNYGTEIFFSTIDEDMLDPLGEYYFIGEDGYQIWVIKSSFRDKILEENNGELPNYVLPDQLTQLTGMDAVKYYWSGNKFYTNTGQLSSESCNQSYSAFKDLINEGAYFQQFLLPLLGGCVMVFALAMSVIVIGQRLFYCVFLFIISPFIVSTRPLDDGARWRKWCEIFLSKLVGAFAIVICLNVFFLLSSWVAGLQFFPKDNVLANGIAKIVVYISGVIAATGASQLMAQLIGSDAGTQERDQAMNNFRSMMGGMSLAKGAIRGAGKTAGMAGKFLGGTKSTPLNSGGGTSTMGANTLASGANNALLGDSMASKIGNTLMGNNTAKDVAKATSTGIANSGIGRMAKGLGTLVGGIGMLPVRAGIGLKNKIQKAYAKKHPQSKIAEKVAKRERLANIKKNTTPTQRARIMKGVRKLGKNIKKDKK